MFQKETSVKNPTGLHARPASQMVQFCKGFPEKITLVAGERRVDPKSIITILAGGLKQGTPSPCRWRESTSRRSARRWWPSSRAWRIDRTGRRVSLPRQAVNAGVQKGGDQLCRQYMRIWSSLE